MEKGYLFSSADHLHTLNGKPLTGTSSVMDVVAKPLTWWASGEAVKTLGWTPKTEYVNGKPRTLPKEPRIEAASTRWDELLEFVAHNPDGEGVAWLETLDIAYGAHANSLKKSAGKGKDLHSELEKYVKYCIEKNEGAPANVKSEDIQNFIDWACDNVEQFLWSEMHTFSEEHWLGGITDAGAKMSDGKIALIDFKSSKAAYASQFLQIAGYSLQIKEKGGYTSKGEKTMEPLEVDEFIVIPFGAPKFTVEYVKETKRHQEGFLAALNLYRLLN